MKSSAPRSMQCSCNPCTTTNSSVTPTPCARRRRLLGKSPWLAASLRLLKYDNLFTQILWAFNHQTWGDNGDLTSFNHQIRGDNEPSNMERYNGDMTIQLKLVSNFGFIWKRDIPANGHVNMQMMLNQWFCGTLFSDKPFIHGVHVRWRIYWPPLRNLWYLWSR